jgi:hypothetical protein
MLDSMTGDVDVDAMVDRFMAEDFVEDEAIPGVDNTRGVMDLAAAMAQMTGPTN